VALLAFAYLGGIARPNGAIIGGALATGSIVSYALTRAWSGFSSYILVFGGLALILTVVLNPDGIAGAPSPLRLLTRRRSGSREVAVATMAAAPIDILPAREDAPAIARNEGAHGTT
jgi:branched-chain amino acid transport system permease protein